MTATARQQTFATLAIAGMFAASIGWGFLERDTATGEPGLPELRTAHPTPAAVGRVAGPFDDRFTLSRLLLRSVRDSGAPTPAARDGVRGRGGSRPRQ